MVENRPILRFLSHLILILGVLCVFLPIWIAFVASTHAPHELLSAPIPWLPGDQFIQNYSEVLQEGVSGSDSISVAKMLFNSMIMALSIAIGKISISILAAYAIVYFQFPFRMTVFWIVFMTLMLPVEVRIVPTFSVIASLGLLNSYAGLSIPLIASATATFLFRQFFMTIPKELVEAAKMDRAGPLKFFRDILLPLSRTNLAALFVILFTYGWNQYLWPLLVTSDESYATIVVSIQKMMTAAESEPQWHLIMATSVLAMIPPVLVVIFMQKAFVKGLVDTEK
ncbi:sn-glycerol-3-phosphate ABC transporter permease UgpE [bacterium]|jgi:sn-glycerol 3-phosphate transport system permease protein|nr:sn-glycerol-3-phosphate ABC transporter permease UgpE [bacterium]